jgi:hypothetical protein
VGQGKARLEKGKEREGVIHTREEGEKNLVFADVDFGCCPRHVVDL